MSEQTARRTAPSTPSQDAAEKQRTASNPFVSSWVSASAGSGKTKVLTDRLLRLLLPREDGQPGTPPEKILALTFTKAGANEMALRLSKRLSAWAVMDDASLSADMTANLLGRTPMPDELLAARKLFARVVDTPGGLKIMTIHSFCQSMLGRFPIESGLPPHFKPLEEDDARNLMVQARRTVLARARSLPTSPLAQAVDHVGQVMTEDQLSALLASMNGERAQLADILSRTFGIDGLYTHLCTLLGIAPTLSEGQALADFCGDEAANASIRPVIAAMAASKSEKEQSKAETLQTYWDADCDERLLHYPAYRDIFLTKEGTLRARLTVADVIQRCPDALEILSEEAERILIFERTIKSMIAAALTRAAFLLGDAILSEYQRLKDRIGGLDFDDLILKTRALLRGTIDTPDGKKAVSPWVLYKMDEGLDHILVDEAQDTNPEQWDIIRLLSEEFFTGLGARDVQRTVFVVGDEKQSIFSFQRAAPDKFGDMFHWFARRIQESGEIFTPVDINTSFRSVQIVLDAVDSVFTMTDTVQGLTTRYLNHIAHRQNQAGQVELWPLFEGSSDEGEETAANLGNWAIPVTLIENQSGASQLASKIGDTIQNWLIKKEPLESYNRPIEPGDIMILMKSRSAFVGQLVRELKQRKIPVSGVDRMILAEQLVVQDLCAAASFALLPGDDLTLASLLKSPFIGYDEQKLYDLTQPRTGDLWQSILSSGDGLTIHWLENLLRRAQSDHPYEFFSRLLQEPCPADSASGLRAIRKRLGEDAFDPLDEFLNLALEYEAAHTAGLQSFLKWHEEGQSEIKRQLEEGGGAVRIMTVHGSKGLQAPIVFLPDTVRLVPPKADSILWPHKTGLSLPLVAPSKDAAPDTALDALDLIRRQQDEEYRRLLYVAMTRAEERLYIAGYTGKRKPAEGGTTPYWYDDVRRAFEARRDAYGDVVESPSGVPDDQGRDKPVLRLSSVRTAAPDKVAKETAGPASAHPALPPYFYKKAPEEPFPPQPLVPSRPSEAEPAAASPLSQGDTSRFKRGTVTHRLLQTLPDLPSGRRQAAAEQFVARTGLGLSSALQKDIVRETMAILNDPVFAPVFGPDSMAEVPVTGFLGGKTLLSGQIDRLVVTEHEVLIVDFKTNRPPPQRPENVPAIYQRQMEAYARAVQAIYPAKKVRCALLWTDGPRLMEIMVTG